MKQVVRKLFFDYEKEEAWLNDMSARGLALTDLSWGRYVFEDAEPGEYLYRIELLEGPVKDPAVRKYIEFVEGTGIEAVATYMRWAYFRKKAADGPFDMFSDIGSRLKHYRRISRMWFAFTIIELVAGFLNVGIGVASWVVRGEPSGNLVIGIAPIALGILFLQLGARVQRKINGLVREQRIRE